MFLDQFWIAEHVVNFRNIIQYAPDYIIQKRTFLCPVMNALPKIDCNISTKYKVREILCHRIKFHRVEDSGHRYII